MVETKEGYRLECSGREFYANGGILGLSIDGVHLSEGYDGGVDLDPIHPDYWDHWNDERPFSPEERQEIARDMIIAWQKWATRTHPEQVTR